MRRQILHTLRAVLLSTVLSVAAHAQGERPELPSDADPNDWEAYFDLGARQLANTPRRAAEAFAWASRIRPDRAEPLFAQWCAFFAGDPPRFERYLRDDERTLADSAVIEAESKRAAAFRRNPFVHQGLTMVAFDKLPGSWREDAVTRGWLQLGAANLRGALGVFGTLVRRDPERYSYLHFVRASAFVNSANNDSARAELDTLLHRLRTTDEKRLGEGYQSKELLEYARGLVLLATSRGDSARAAFQSSVVENPGFAPAHAMLGLIAATHSDTSTTLLELGQAVELEPNYAPFRVDYARALVRAGRSPDAIRQLERAIAISPYYAEPYYLLAGILAAKGDAPGAAKRAGDFLGRATRADPRRTVAEGWQRGGEAR